MRVSRIKNWGLPLFPFVQDALNISQVDSHELLTIMKILIVDDSVRMQNMISHTLKEVADEFVMCQDGSEALMVYATQQPDWVIMDINMTTMDGIKALKQIKHYFPEAKILMLTQYDSVILREEADQAGAQGYVLKNNLLKIKDFLPA